MSTPQGISQAIADQPEIDAREAGLRYVSDDRPGFTRRKQGDEFIFFDQQGERIKDEHQIQRIKSLAIPPAYQDVWICPSQNGHLQATGKDVRGRKQYRYHPKWREARDSNKFERMMAFGKALPSIRRKVSADLAREGLGRERILATVVRLLEISLIRVGNEEYAKTNRSYGLSTMRRKHAKVKGSTIHFHFRGKSGKEHDIEVEDRRLAKVVRKCQDLPGQDLFKYVDANEEINSISSDDVNNYLQEISGESFTAKDFRTWFGTVLAAIALREFEAVDSKALAKKNVVTAIESVARMLGNTPAICRKCYVHPSVIDYYMEGTLVQRLEDKVETKIRQELSSLRPEEAAVLTLLQRRLRADEDGIRLRPEKGAQRVGQTKKGRKRKP